MSKNALLCLTVAHLCLTGCASNLATLADPEITPRGRVHVGVAAGAYIPSRPIINAIDVGVKVVDRAKDMAQSGGEVKPLSDDEKRSLINASLAFALQPPSAGWELQARTGVFDNVDVGFRYSVSQVRGDVRYRFFHSEKWENGAPPPPLPEDASFGQRMKEAFRMDERARSYDATVQLGVSYYLFSNPLVEVLDAVKLGDFSRWDFDLAITWGVDVRRMFKFYAGPKFIYTRFSLDEQLYDLANTATAFASEPAVTTSVSHNMFFGGAVVGLATGYKYVWLYTELTAGYTYARPTVLGEVRDLGGATFYPTIGIAVKAP